MDHVLQIQILIYVENTALDNFVISTINKMVALGGTKVSEEVYQKRLEVCRACVHYGEVQPLPYVVLDGCTICGCPSATKPRFETNFSLSRMKVVKTECPDKVNKWDF